MPHIRFLFARSRLCSALPSDAFARPCASLVLHLHQVGQWTFTPSDRSCWAHHAAALRRIALRLRSRGASARRVILGAGLDTFSLRNPSCGQGLRVFAGAELGLQYVHRPGCVPDRPSSANWRAMRSRTAGLTRRRSSGTLPAWVDTPAACALLGW